MHKLMHLRHHTRLTWSVALDRKAKGYVFHRECRRYAHSTQGLTCCTRSWTNSAYVSLSRSCACSSIVSCSIVSCCELSLIACSIAARFLKRNGKCKKLYSSCGGAMLQRGSGGGVAAGDGVYGLNSSLAERPSLQGRSHARPFLPVISLRKFHEWRRARMKRQ